MNAKWCLGSVPSVKQWTWAWSAKSDCRTLLRGSLKLSCSSLQTPDYELPRFRLSNNLCHRGREVDGTVEICRERSISLLAHSPLGHGLLSGKYDPSHAPKGPRSIALNPQVLAQTEPIRRYLRICAEELSCEPAQVALAWLRAHNATPIVGVNNAAHAHALSRLPAVQLGESRLAELDEITAVWRR